MDTEKAKGVARTLLRQLENVHSERRDKLYKFAVRCETAAAISNMIRLARGLPGIVLQHDQLDANPNLLNVLNGTIELDTGTFRPHNPDDLCTLIAPVHYQPDAQAPLWHTCLEHWQPNPDIRNYLQLEAGAATTGQPTETCSVHYGPGGNGKSRYIGALAAVLGEYSVELHESLLMVTKHEQHATVIATLFRARLALASETPAGGRINESVIKRLTGGDRLRARRMREDEWAFWPTHTVIMATNHLPHVSGRDEGIWRRIRLIPWQVSIPRQDQAPRLADKLRAEASGILNWLLAGAQRFLADGLNNIPDAVTAATDNYRESEDVISRFAAERLTLGVGRITTEELRKEVVAWCTENGLPDIKQPDLAAYLTERGHEAKQGRVGGKKKTVWHGVSAADSTLLSSDDAQVSQSRPPPSVSRYSAPLTRGDRSE